MCRRRPTAGTTRGPNRAATLLPDGGVVPDDSARLAAVPHLLHKPERFCGAADFTVLSERG